MSDFTWQLDLVSIILWVFFSIKVFLIKWQKIPKICLTWKLLFRSFDWSINFVLKVFQVSFRTFFRKMRKFPAKYHYFYQICLIIRTRKKKKILEHHFYKILRLFDVLASFLFSKSEARANSYLSTWYIRVASRVFDLLKT